MNNTKSIQLTQIKAEFQTILSQQAYPYKLLLTHDRFNKTQTRIHVELLWKSVTVSDSKKNWEMWT